MTSVTDIGNLSVVEPKGASGLSSETTIMELEKGALPNPNGRVPLVELPYSLRTRKLKIAILVLLVCLDGFILPTALFYILKYGGMSDGKSKSPTIPPTFPLRSIPLKVNSIISHNTDVAVTTSVFGFMSIIQFTVRLYRLLKPRSPYLPLNSPSRWYLDFYQIQFTMGFIMITLVLTLATVSPSTGKLYLRAISLPPALLMFQCGPQFLLSCYAYKAKWKNAFRMSSMLAGENCVPAVYTMVEDVIGVDGRGGRDFRQRWKDRYTQSERFREMCYRQTIFWGVGITVCAALTTGVVFAEGVDEYVAYGIGE